MCVTLRTIPDYYGEMSGPTDIQYIGGPLPVGCSLLLSQYICNYPLYSDAVSFSHSMQTLHAAGTRNLADSCEQDTDLS
jgi:hypothetical protein